MLLLSLYSFFRPLSFLLSFLSSLFLLFFSSSLLFSFLFSLSLPNFSLVVVVKCPKAPRLFLENFYYCELCGERQLAPVADRAVLKHFLVKTTSPDLNEQFQVNISSVVVVVTLSLLLRSSSRFFRSSLFCFASFFRFLVSK